MERRAIWQKSGMGKMDLNTILIFYCLGNLDMQDWSQAGVYIPLMVGLIPGFIYWCVITAKKHK